MPQRFGEGVQDALLGNMFKGQGEDRSRLGAKHHLNGGGLGVVQSGHGLFNRIVRLIQPVAEFAPKALGGHIDLLCTFNKRVDQSAGNFVKERSHQITKHTLKSVVQVKLYTASALILKGVKIPYAREFFERALDQLEVNLAVELIHVSGGERLLESPNRHPYLSGDSIVMGL